MLTLWRPGRPGHAGGAAWSVIIARGWPAWLTAPTALAPARPVRAVDERSAEPASRLLPARVELTTVLAGMVLLCAQPREGSSRPLEELELAGADGAVGVGMDGPQAEFGTDTRRDRLGCDFDFVRA